MNPVIHFEMPYEDQARLQQFYQAAFGWQMRSQGPESGDYVMATTTPSNERGPIETGAINGGFFPKKPDWPMQYPSVVISVPDINAAMEKVRAAGGEVLGEPMMIPDVGQYVSFVDTEGNRASILQPSFGDACGN